MRSARRCGIGRHPDDGYGFLRRYHRPAQPAPTLEHPA
nr:MAG TPA: hypothetical protein [Caudoviricetes sp.]